MKIASALWWAWGIFITLAVFAAETPPAKPPAGPVTVLRLADSVNPGTADYLVAGIESAERARSPYVVIEIDTPGGLLTSTRQIVQKMLASPLPVVVYIAPAGARAGSAGALITLAADVAAMAPGTNIGAAHPVSGTGETVDKTMQEKIVNDTAAFAQSLAKARGRNLEVAAKFVRQSTSLTADEALKNGIIDLLAADENELQRKLPGFTLKLPKGNVTSLPSEASTWQPLAATIKQRVVAFLADPSLAYLILCLGGLCLWIELSHPGLVAPGVVGIFCLIFSLISFQMLPIRYGALGLILLGMVLIVAELFLPTYGALGVAGLVAFVFGSLFLMDTNVPEFQISQTLIFPVAAALACSALFLAMLIWRSRRLQPRSGMEALVGAYGEVRDAASEKPGKVFIQGELWNAISKTGEMIPQGAVVVVTEVRNLLLVVAARE